MLRLLTILITILLLPVMAFAWPGKIIAVEGATSFVVLKDGQTPVKVNIAGVKPVSGMDPAKARLESSNTVLMRDVEVRELSKTEDGTIVGDITVDGKSLSKELLDEGIVQSSAQAPAAVDPAPVEIPKETSPPTTAAEASKAQISESKAEAIADDLLPKKNIQNQDFTPEPQIQQMVPQPQPQVHYVQVYQQPQQQLGLWPGRPAPVAAQPAQQIYHVQQPGLQTAQQNMPNDRQAQVPQDMNPGDTAKRDYELAVRVHKNTRHKKNKGFFVPKKKSETFVGVAGGVQGAMKSKNEAPFSSFGGLGGLSVRHFYPSGFGIGGDMFMSSSKGTSGTYGQTTYTNGTIANNGTDYDYKSKSFNTYTFTGSLLYRFYADRKFTPYIAGHVGYSFFDYPNNIFKISDGAPVAGGGGGFLYEFDSGFTIGLDTRYLKTIGGKKDDPSGFFDTIFNVGYTFD